MNPKPWTFVLLLAVGCQSSPQQQTASSADLTTDSTSASQGPTVGSDPIARVGAVVITRDQLTRPLLAEYGMNLAVGMLRQELAEQRLREAGRTLTDEDVAEQRQRTLSTMFADAAPEDYDELLAQLLQREGASETQFNMILRTNAALRKLSAPIVEERLTPELLDQTFRVRYGEKARVRHIEMNSLQDVAEAQRRLAAGEEFADVAAALSVNARTASQGGLVPPFSRQSTGLPAAFREAAFALEIGEVSDPVNTGDRYHLLKLDELIEPELAKFEDVQAGLKDDLRESLINAATGQYLREIDAQIRREVRFQDPSLREQYQEAIAPPPTTAPAEIETPAPTTQP